MPATAQRLLIFSANALIWIFLALFLASCARQPMITKTSPPIRQCPAPVLYSDVQQPMFHGNTWQDLAAFVEVLKSDGLQLRADRRAIADFCNDH